MLPHYVLTVSLIAALQVPVLPSGSFPQLQPLSFGEGIALNPLPAKEMRWVVFGSTYSVGHWNCCVSEGIHIALK